jgi:hypothetical protein
MINLSNISWDKIIEAVNNINTNIDSGMSSKINLGNIVIYNIKDNVIRIDIKK